MSTLVRKAATRGVIAAMAMTGMRRLTTTLGLVAETPPEELLRSQAPRIFYRVPERRRPALVEGSHWLYGAAGGAAFGMLPERFRRWRLAGPLYGVTVWALFEAGIAPVLGLPRSGEQRSVERFAFLVDHVLYGVIVASPGRDILVSPPPEGAVEQVSLPPEGAGERSDRFEWFARG